LVISLGERPILSKHSPLAEQAINKWRQWQAPFQSKPQIVSQLEGGLTNINYLIEAGSERAVLRINNPQAHKLGINRQSEITILKKLQSTDFVSRLYYSDSRILVTEYIDGYALNAEQALKPDTKRQIEQILSVVQSFEFNDVDTLNYESYLREYCSQLSPDYLDHKNRQALFRIARDIDNQNWSPVLCHHDLIPENIIQGAKGLFFIDWEYASMGHPQFDYQRLLNSHHFMAIPANKCGLQALQAIMIQLWYAIRYPKLQEDIKKELIKIIETVNL
jgi:thiamine kinase